MKSIRFLSVFAVCLFFLTCPLFAGGLYITTVDNEDNAGTGVPDNDMGSGIAECVDINSQIHPVEFNIQVSGSLPVSSAYLSVFIKDVDWPNEQDEVFLNGHSVGFAGGQNNLDNSTLFVIPDLSWIKQGNNLVQIFVDQNHVSNYWCAEVQSGQLIFDDDTGINTASIRTAVSNASAYNYGENVTIDLEVDTSLTTQDVRLELVLRDAVGTLIGFDTNSAARNWKLTGNSDEPYKWTFKLPASGQDGLWAVSITVYDVADSQFLTRKTITFAVPAGAVNPPPVLTSISPDNCFAGEAKAVVIQGSNFIQGDTLCTVGSLPMGNVVVVDNTRITGNVSSSLSAGTHTVVCTTSNGQATLANAFTVNPSPVAADFSADKTLGTPPLAVQFTDHSAGSPVSWQWDFNNDGIIDSEIQHPAWTYSQEGIFTVALTVGNGAVTDTKTKTDYITVSPSVQTVNLSVADLRVPPSATSLNPSEINWKIQNMGQGSITGSWIDKVYLSADNVLNEGDTLLGEFARTESLNADSSYTRTEQMQIPAAVASGIYYIIVKTDSSETVYETSENDNVLAKQITIAKAKLMTAAPDQISLNLNPGVPVSGKIDITNISIAAISGITATVDGASPNIHIQVDAPAQLESMASAEVSYTVTASDLSAAESAATLVFAGTQGASATVNFDITVIPGTPKLLSDPGYLEYGMLRGRQSLYEFEVSNMGGAAAENLQVMIPAASWLTLVTPENLGTLAPGGKSKIGIMLSPSETMALGPYSGDMLIRGSNTALRISFRFIAVSEAKGGLKITAKDEFSYFAEDHPNVKNAKVLIKDAFADTVIAEGVTDDTGIFEISSVNEGRYAVEVSAEKHSTYHSTIEIVPGMVKEIEAFLARQLVTYRWSVVPVEIQDNYKVTLEAVFETHVPAPVVTIDPNFQVVPFYEGETATVNLTITNHGLIAANKVRLNFPESQKFNFDPLMTDIGTLPAMTSIVIPVTVSAKSVQERKNSGSGRESDAGGGDECLTFTVCSSYICTNEHTNCTSFSLKPIEILLTAISGIECAMLDPLACLSLACSLGGFDPCACMLIPPPGPGNVLDLIKCLCGLTLSGSGGGGEGDGDGEWGGGGISGPGGYTELKNPCK